MGVRKGILIAGMITAAVAYATRDGITKYIAGSEIFEKKPIRHELGVPIYTGEELGDLVDKEFPMTITPSGRWSAHPDYSSPIERLQGRLNPTHIIYFSPTEDGNYRFDVKHR